MREEMVIVLLFHKSTLWHYLLYTCSDYKLWAQLFNKVVCYDCCVILLDNWWFPHWHLLVENIENNWLPLSSWPLQDHSFLFSLLPWLDELTKVKPNQMQHHAECYQIFMWQSPWIPRVVSRILPFICKLCPCKGGSNNLIPWSEHNESDATLLGPYITLEEWCIIPH